METTNYTSIGPVLQLNKAGELTQKRMKAVKVCDGLYISEPDKHDFVRYIIECNGVMWVENIQHKSYAPRYAAAMPKALERVKSGFYGDERFNKYRHEIDRRVNHPDAPAIMELKKPERKKPAPLAENERKVSVLMFKGCTNEITEKKVVITEVAPHVYTYAYKLKRYGERVKIIFEIDGVYFQGSDNSAYVLERENFIEVCTKAYEHARKNVAEGAAKGMRFLVEVQKRIDATEAPEATQTDEDNAEVALPAEDINYMFYIKPKGAKRFSTYNPGKGTMGTGLVFTELYRKEHLSAVCKWIAEDNSGDFAYQLRSGDGKKIYWEHNPIAAPSTETPQISTETAETVNVSAEGEKAAETKEMPQILNCEWQTVEHFKAIPNIAKLAKAGIIINGVAWHTEYLDQTHNVLARVDNLGWHDDGKGYGGFQGGGVFGKTAIFESWDDAVIATIDALTDYLRTENTEPPQSPETTLTAECTAEPRKLAQTA